MNKKLFSIIGAFFLSVVLMSCGGKSSSNSEPSLPNSTSVNTPSSSTNLGSNSKETSNLTPSSDNPSQPSVVIPEGKVAVNFRYNYGENLCFKIIPMTPGDKVEKPSIFDQPQRSGYMFYGWYEDIYCMHEFDFENSVVPETDLDIYAGWTVFDADPLGDQAIEDKYVEKTYSITYTSGQGFSYINPHGALIQSADAGDVIEFKLAIGSDYEGTPVVTANGQTLTLTGELYRHTVTDNTTFAVSGITKKVKEDDNKNLVPWYLCGKGSLWPDDSWSISSGVQLYENPDNPEDKGQYLGITFAVGDTFKVTDGTTWYGYEMIDTWDDPANKGLANFIGVPDGFNGRNIQCSVAGTYDIYVNGSGKLWIQDAAI